jgi:hypothetical protein
MRRARGQRQFRCLLTGSVLSLTFCAAVLGYASGRFTSLEARELLLLIRPTLFYTCALLALGAFVCAVNVRRGRPLAALAALCGSWFLASATILVAANSAQSLFSAKDIALALRLHEGMDGAQGAPIYSVQSYQQSLPFYLRRPVVLVDYRDEFDFGLSQDPQLGVATLDQFARGWLPLRAGWAVMPPKTRDRLRA